METPDASSTEVSPLSVSHIKDLAQHTQQAVSSMVLDANDRGHNSHSSAAPMASKPLERVVANNQVIDHSLPTVKDTLQQIRCSGPSGKGASDSPVLGNASNSGQCGENSHDATTRTNADFSTEPSGAYGPSSTSNTNVNSTGNSNSKRQGPESTGGSGGSGDSGCSNESNNQFNTNASEYDQISARSVSNGRNIATDNEASSHRGGGHLTLDFAKRDIAESVHMIRSQSAISARTLAGSEGSEHSNLGSRLAGSRKNSQSSEISNSSATDSPPLPADDDERIRTPASAMLSRHSSLDIGLRQPFGPQSRGGGKSPDSARSPGSSDENSSQNPNSSGIRLSLSQLQPQGKWDFAMRVVPAKRLKHYEPASFILNTNSSGNESPVSGNNTAQTSPVGPGQPKANAANAISPANVDQDKPANAAKSSSQVSQYLPLAPPVHNRRRGKRVNGRPSIENLSKTEVGPRIERPLKQLREPRQPLYIPAVLRPTEPASYKSAPTKYVPVLGAGAIAMPDTRHWMPDESSDNCRSCGKSFSWFNRRHHCRKCGEVFCGSDSKHVIGLDRNLNFNLFGHPCRACSGCASEFAKYASDVPRLHDGPTTSTALQGPKSNAAVAINVDSREDETMPHYVGSVATAQDWSTF